MTAKLLLITAALPFALWAAGPATPQADTASSDAMAGHVALDVSDLKWGDAPPQLPAGAQLAVLSGDPSKSGWFVIRLKAPAGYKVPLHWHPTAEQVTVLEGDFTLQMGDDAGNSRTFGPGGFGLLPAHMHHAASTQGGATVQVEGMGPFEIHYVNPKDDPSMQAPAPDSTASD